MNVYVDTKYMESNIFRYINVLFWHKKSFKIKTFSFNLLKTFIFKFLKYLNIFLELKRTYIVTKNLKIKYNVLYWFKILSLLF